jgi:type IX secretion system PorP/SprF family membrane protein
MAGSYHLKFPTFRLAFGLQLNLSQYNIGLSTVQHSIDGSVDNAFSSNIKETTFNFGTGAFAYAKNWYAGISIPHFRKNVLSVNTTELNLTAFEAPHFYLQGGYIYELNPMITLKPNTLVKYVKGAPMNADFNLNVYYKKTYGVGLGYRTDNSMIAMLEIQANPNWKFGYAFDYTLSDLATYANNSHELFVRFAIAPKGTHLSPRLY